MGSTAAACAEASGQTTALELLVARKAAVQHGEAAVRAAAGADESPGVSEAERLDMEAPTPGSHQFWSQQARSVLYEGDAGAAVEGRPDKARVGILRPKELWPKPEEEQRPPAPQGLEWCHFGEGDVRSEGEPAVELDEILALQFSDAPEEASSPLGGFHFIPSREMLWRSLSRPGTDRKLWIALRLGEEGGGGLAGGMMEWGQRMRATFR